MFVISSLGTNKNQLLHRLQSVQTRVLLDWIGGLTNPDCNPFCWIGL